MSWRGLAYGVCVFLLAACGPADAPQRSTQILASVSTVGVTSAAAPPSIPLSLPIVLGALGEQKIAILLVNFSDRALLSAVTPSLLQQAYFGKTNSVDAWLREASYGKAWATGRVFDAVTIQASLAGDLAAVRDAAVLATKADLRSYTRLVIVVPQAASGLETGGSSSRNAEAIKQADGSSATLTTSWLGDASMGGTDLLLESAVHELGHNFGLLHARAADFGDEAAGPVGLAPLQWSPNARNNTLAEYGDSYANMGRGIGHWSAPHKAALGWLDDGVRLQGVQASGTVLLRSYEDASPGLQAVRVRRGDGNAAWLWLEYRSRAAGSFDAGLASAASAGVLVHLEDPAWLGAPNYSYLVRMQPDGANGLYFGNPALTAGASWSDPWSNLTIRVDSITSAGAQVSISYAAAPAVTLAASKNSLGWQGGSISVNVSAATGTAWSAQSSASWLRIASGASGNGNGSITLQAEPSGLANQRWAKLTVGGALYIVVQDGVTGDIAFAPDSFDFPASGGTGEVTVTTNTPDYFWSCAASDPWIDYLTFSSLIWSGPGKMRFTVLENTSSSERTGTLRIQGKSVTIRQAAGSSLSAKVKVEELPLADAPLPRTAFAMVMPARGDALLYGGSFSNTFLGDTWTWNGSAWTQRQPAHSPGLRRAAAMAWDAARGQAVLFSGLVQGIYPPAAETWLWNGSDWSMAAAQTDGPAGRDSHSMAYHAGTGRILLFGGTHGQADTWEWDGTKWLKRAPALSPPARMNAAMAYDEARGAVVLFGGMSPDYQRYFNDMWSWDGNRWSELKPDVKPSPRAGAGLAWHPGLGRLVMLGGQGPFSGTDAQSFAPYDTEFWSWDGSRWEAHFPATLPDFAFGYGMGYREDLKQFQAFISDSLVLKRRGPHLYVISAGPGAPAAAQIKPATPSPALPAEVPSWAKGLDCARMAGPAANGGAGVLCAR